MSNNNNDNDQMTLLQCGCICNGEYEWNSSGQTRKVTSKCRVHGGKLPFRGNKKQRLEEQKKRTNADKKEYKRLIKKESNESKRREFEIQKAEILAQLKRIENMINDL